VVHGVFLNFVSKNKHEQTMKLTTPTAVTGKKAGQKNNSKLDMDRET